MKTDGVIFDIDGTIWDSTEIIAKAWNDVIENTGFSEKRVTPDDLRSLFGKKMEEIVYCIFPELNEEQRDILAKGFCAKEHIYLQKDAGGELAYPDIRETIEALSRRFPVFIVSNCQSGYIELVCEKTSIADHISDSECYGDTGLGKAENIKNLCARNGLEAPVYVGDTDGDRLSCEEAGVRFIFASYGFGNTEKYEAKIASCRELLTLLD